MFDIAPKQGNKFFIASQYMIFNRRVAPSILTDFERFYIHGKQPKSRNAACDVRLSRKGMERI